MERPLLRMNEHEPELYRNLIEDQTQVEKDLITISYGGVRR